MKKLLASVLLFAACALGADVTGTWSGSAEATRGDGSTRTDPVVFRLKQDGVTVTGSAIGDSDTFEIQNGKIASDTVTFEIVAGDSGRIFKFHLKIEGDSLSGKASSTSGGEGEQIRSVKVSLQRQK
jgi:hypothetical protein